MGFAAPQSEAAEEPRWEAYTERLSRGDEERQDGGDVCGPYVDKKGLQMRAADMGWAWVAHKAHRGQVVGKVFRPELGKLAQHEEQVLQQLVAMATTGKDTAVREKITRETLWRVVLSRQVLKSVYRVTDRDRAMQNGVSVEQLQDMDLEPIVMKHGLAAMVWQNTNKLAGLTQGGGAGRARFWACMHLLLREGLIDGSVWKHPRDKSCDGMADEVRRLQALGTGKHPPKGPLRDDLGDSPDDSEEEAEDGGRDNAAAPGTGAEAGAGQLMILGGLEKEVGGAGAAGQGRDDEERGDSTEEPRGAAEHGGDEESDSGVAGTGRGDRAVAGRGAQGQVQGEGGTGEMERRGGVSRECQAWQETALVAKGEMVVPRLRSGRRGTQEPTEEEVHIVATAVGTEEGRCTLGKRDLEGPGGNSGGGEGQQGR